MTLPSADDIREQKIKNTRHSEQYITAMLNQIGQRLLKNSAHLKQGYTVSFVPSSYSRIIWHRGMWEVYYPIIASRLRDAGYNVQIATDLPIMSSDWVTELEITLPNVDKQEDIELAPIRLLRKMR